MNVTKQLLVKAFTAPLKGSGYAFLKDSQPFYSGMFYRIVEREGRQYALTLVFCKSRFDHEIFTVELRFNRVFCHLFNAGVYKSKCGISSGGRIGHFTEYEDRVGFGLEERYLNNPNIVDLWWNGLSLEVVEGCFRAIKKAEEALLSQPRLFELIDDSNEIKEELELIEKVKCRTETITEEDRATLKYQPKRYRDGIPREWFEAAEVVIKEFRPHMNIKAYTDTLAVSAFRTCTLLR